MRITIDIDPSTAIANVTSSISAPAAAITQAATQPVAQGVALSAGTSLVADSGEGASTLLPQNTPAGITAGESAAPPTPHPDSFGLAFGMRLSEEGLSAGSAIG